MTDPLDLLASMVLEDGGRWGDRVAPFQWDAARTLLDVSAPPFRWESRPRGGSKTTDVAGIAVAAMLTQLAPGARCDAYAGDRDQARLLVDALAGLVRRTPGLAAMVTVDAYKATTRAGVTLEVMAADAASAHGRRPSWVVVDEVCQWPSTPNARGLWEAVYSSMPKVPGARLAVITTSGDPVHWSRRVRDAALGSSLWTVAEIPGPLVWMDRAQLVEQRRMLSDSAYARLHLNQWAASEARLVTPALLAAAAVLDGPQPPVAGHRYFVGADLGLRNDRTAIAVVHAEPVGEPAAGVVRNVRVVLDELTVLQGSREREVDLGQVEEVMVGVSGRFNGAPVRLDPWQAIGLAQRLRPRGLSVEEWSFTPQKLAGMAQTLLTLLRDRLLWLPDDAALLDELATVRLRESGSTGLMRIDHEPGRHDDRVTALGLAVTAALEDGWSVAAPLSGREDPVARWADIELAGRDPGAAISSWARAGTPVGPSPYPPATYLT